MTLSNEELVEAFVNGETNGQSNNMRIVTGPIERDGRTHVLEGETAIVGYGWAVYAKRTSSGRVVVYNGWHDWAKGKDGQSGSTTLRHLSLIESEAGPTHMLKDRQPQSDEAPNTASTMEPEYRH